MISAQWLRLLESARADRNFPAFPTCSNRIDARPMAACREFSHPDGMRARLVEFDVLVEQVRAESERHQ
jgi:hypothetical protein